MPKAGEAILALFNKLGGNMNNVLGSRSNITFLGRGRTPEGFIDSDINIDAIGVLGKGKVLEELESSIGYLTAGKLNDVQANKLLSNMQKVDEVFNPKAIANITDMATGIRNLDQEGIASLRAEQRLADDVVKDVSDMEFDIRSQFPKASEDEIRALVNRVESEVPKRPANYDELSMDDRRLNDIEAENIYRQILKEADDLPPPEETFKNTQNILREQMNKLNAPSKRGTAREFLVEALKKDETDVGTAAFGKTNLNNIISTEDVKYITEGGGGIGGDPIVLVEKYFGPRVAEALPSGASNEEIIIFTKRVLENVEDAAGLKPDNPRFDKFTARFVDEMADGGRVGLRFGRLAGRAFGLMKKQQALEKGLGRGYADMRKYGIEGEDITNMFKELSMDSSLVGAEKTAYFKVLNEALKNPNKYPDTIKEIQTRLGIEVGTGFKSGGRVAFQDGGKGADEGGHSRFEVGSGYYGETPTTSGGEGNNQNSFIPPVNVSIQPENTPLGPLPRFADLDLATKYGILNLRTDLIDTIKDEDLDSQLNFTGALGPVNINAMADIDGNKSLGLGYNKGNFSAGATTNFDGDNQIGFSYNKTFAKGGLAKILGV